MSQPLLPNSSLGVIDTSDNINPSKTWLLKKDRLASFVDGKEAIKQSIQAILSTSRYEHLIYSWNYGHELNSLIGKDKDFIKAEVKRIIKEALVQDDRISDVTNLVFTDSTDGLLVEFDVLTAEGTIESAVVL